MGGARFLWWVALTLWLPNVLSKLNSELHYLRCLHPISFVHNHCPSLRVRPSSRSDSPVCLTWFPASASCLWQFFEGLWLVIEDIYSASFCVQEDFLLPSTRPDSFCFYPFPEVDHCVLEARQCLAISLVLKSTFCKREPSGERTQFCVCVPRRDVFPSLLPPSLENPMEKRPWVSTDYTMPGLLGILNVVIGHAPS